MRLNLDSSATSRFVTDQSDIERLRWFQARRYHDTGLFSELPAQLEEDPLADQCIYFGVYGPNNEIWGTSRLIPGPLTGLPLFDHQNIDPDVLEVLQNHDSRQICEVSRLAVSRGAPQLEALSGLVRQMLRHTVETGSKSIVLGSVDAGMVRIIQHIFRMPCEVIGPVLPDYFGRPSYPIMIDTVRYLMDLRYRDHKSWDYFTQDLVIDLRTGLSPLPVPERSLAQAS